MFPALSIFWQHRLSIKLKIVLVSTTFILALLGSVTYFLIDYFSTEMCELIHQQQMTVLQHVANEVDEKINFSHTHISQLAQQISATKLEKNAVTKLLEDQYSVHQQLFNSGVFVYDEKGNILVDYPAINKRSGSNISNRDFFKALQKTQQFVVSEPQYSKHLVGSAPVIIVSIPIFNQQGSMIGGISGVILVANSHLFNNIRQTRVGRNGYYMVLSNQFRILVTPNYRQFFVQINPGDFGTTVSKQLTQHHSGHAEVTVNNKPGIFSFVHSKQTNWIIASFIPNDEIFSPVDQITQHALGVVVVIMLLSGFCLWLIIYTLLRPFSKLYAGVINIKQNASNKFLENLSHSSHEAGQLSKAFLDLLNIVEEKTYRLQEKVNFITALMNAIPAMVFFKDKAGRYLSVNEYFYKLPFLSSREVIGKTIFDVAPKEVAEKIAQYEKELLMTGGMHHHEIGFEDKANTRMYYGLIYRASFQDAHGNIAGFVGLVLDVTQQHEQEAALRAATETAIAANQAKSVFLANMSHEIRTPMNGVLGMLDLVLETRLTQEQQEYLQLAKNSASALLALINDILDFSKIEAGKLNLECIEFSLPALIDESLKIIASRNAKIGLEIMPNFDDNMPNIIVGDPTRLRQVLLNLLGNALKFTEQGVIELRVKLLQYDETHVEVNFAVSDTGIGIAAEKLQSIFEAFTQADNTITRRFGGTGLGLSISNRLVQAMGGKLSVQSILQQGTTFSFNVPFKYKHNAELSMVGLPAEAQEKPWLILSGQNIIGQYWAQTLRELGCMVYAMGDEKQLTPALIQALPVAYVLCDEQLLVQPPVQQYLCAQKPHWEMIVLNRLGSNSPHVDLNCLGHLLQPSLGQFVPQALKEIFSSVSTDTTVLASQSANLPALRILLAEDNPVNQIYARTLLQKMGHKVVVVDNGQAALDVLTQGVVDVVLMDVQMPLLDGLSATMHLREREQAQQLTPHYVVAMTAYAMPEDEQRCLAAGMDAYLSKPVQAATLMKLLQPRQRLKAQQMSSANEGLTLPEDLAVINKAALQQQWQGDKELFTLVVTQVLAAVPKQLQTLQASVRVGDVDAIHRAAHTLKGSVANVAADTAQQAAFALEQAAKTAHGDYAALLVTVEQEVARLLEVLPTLLD